ncbi:hypothetical protein CGH88_23005 [Vibrio parahaemolyticus]|nr:hypothetical protein CGH88_23005 [Vibrio parahaemolyticus]
MAVSLRSSIANRRSHLNAALGSNGEKMTETIIISIGTSLIAALLYGLFIANKEEAIRQYLKTRAVGFLRNWYVKALVGAIRGEDKITESSQMSFVWVFIVLLLAYTSHNFIDDIVTTHNENVEYIEKEILGNDPFDKMTLEEQSSALLERSQKLIDDVKKADEIVKNAEKIMNVIYWAAWSYYVYFFSFRRPYLLLRKRFSHEFSRYNAHIQGLACKKELAELSVLESKVRDEESLKKLIEKTLEVAKRHDVSELTDSFDLWKAA